MKRYDLLVIGAGSGGVRAARLAAEAGASVAIAEQARPGGTCVICGCVPKKFLVMASGFPLLFKEAAGFGWRLGESEYRHEIFMPRLHREIDRLSGLYASALARAGAELLSERAEIIDVNRVRLASGLEVEAEKILIATGGAARRPAEIVGGELAVVSDDMFQLSSLPKSALILGGGYIAVEFAGILNGLGVRTSLAYRGDLILRGFDKDLRQRVQTALLASGVELFMQASPEDIVLDRDARLVRFADGRMHRADLVLMALGRNPASAGLGLERVGIALDSAGAIPVDAQSRTRIENIWAIGDVTNRVNLTPVAIREAEAFARREFYGEDTVFSHENIPSAVFSQPPAATIGLGEDEARKLGMELDIYCSDFRPMRDMLAESGTAMFIKLVVEADSGRIAGCHIVGPEAPELMQILAIAVNMGATKADFDRTCALHPTLAEEIVTLRRA